MPITSAQQASLYRLTVGMFGAAPGTVYLDQLSEAVLTFMAAGQSATAAVTSLYRVLQSNATFQAQNFAYSDSSTDSQFATYFINQLLGSTVTTAAKADGVTYVTNQLTAGKTRGEAIEITLNALAAVPVSDATYGKAAQQLANKVSVAQNYTETLSGNSTVLATLQNTVSTVTDTAASVTAANTANAGTGASGQTFVLTTNADNIVGTSGNDTINGALDDNTAANNTISVLDTINGGSGTDTLNITVDTSAAGVAFPAANVSNVEQFVFRNVSGQTLTVDTTLFAGETTVTSDRSTNQVNITGIASGVTIGLKGDGVVTNGALDLTAAASVTALTLAASGGMKAGAIAIKDAADSVTALTITSTDAANTVGAIDLDADAGTNAVKTLTVNATTNLTTGNITNFAGSSTINVSGAATLVTLGTLEAANVTKLDASGLTAGGVSATLNAVATISVTGGAGNDRITTGGVALTTGSVDAGAGSNDRLAVANTADIDATTGKLYKNFEELSVVNGVTVNVDQLSSANTLTSLRLTTGGVVSNVNATMGAAVTITTGGNSPTIAIKNATLTGQIDTLKITADDGDTTTATNVNIATPVFAGVENIELTVNSGDTFTIADLTSAPAISSLKLQGAGTYSVTSAALALVPNVSVDASTATGNVTLVFTAATTNAFSFTGGSKVDTVTYGVIGGNVITTGAGKDVVNATDSTGGTSGNIITLGASADSFNFGAAEGQATQDTVTFKYVAGDSISTGTTVTDVTNADTISAVAWDDAATAANGQKFTIDTPDSATAVVVSNTVPVFGTTTTANAFDFYVQWTAANTDVYVYQDTNGNKVLDTGEFMVKLVGDANFVANNANDFTITSGNLVFTSNDGA